MTFEDGSYYEGEFKKDMMHGKGVIHYANGNLYVGTFLNDQKHNTGTLFDVETKTKQREDWANGKRTNVIKTTTTDEEIDLQMRNPGYLSQFSPSKRDARATFKAAGLKVQKQLAAVKAFQATAI